MHVLFLTAYLRNGGGKPRLEGNGEIAVGLGVIAHKFGEFFQVDMVQDNTGGQLPGGEGFLFGLFLFLFPGLLLAA